MIVAVLGLSGHEAARLAAEEETGPETAPAPAPTAAAPAAQEPPRPTEEGGEAAKPKRKTIAPPRSDAKTGAKTNGKTNGKTSGKTNGKAANGKTNGARPATPAAKDTPPANEEGAKGAQPKAGGAVAAPAEGQAPPGPAGGIGAPPGPAPAGAGAAGAAEPGDRTTIFPRSAEFLNQTVEIEAGDIPVLEFVRFLSDYTGLKVIADARNPTALNGTINIVSPMKDASGEIVVAILQANGFLVTRKTIASGEEVLIFEPQTAAAPVGGDEPQETPILDVKEGQANLIDTRVETGVLVRPDEIATMVFTLKYTQPTDAITALNNLIGGAGKPARSKAFSIVDVKNSMLLIITAKFGLLSYLQKLLQIIDVPIKEAERIVEIINVENADAEELTNLINQFFQGRTGTAGRFATRPTPAPAPGQPGQPLASIAGGGRQGSEVPNLIPDWRTQKIIVETYSEKDLEDIFMLVRELDTRYDIRRLKTRIYQVKYLKAEEVAADLQQLIGGGSFGLSGRAGLGTRAGAAAGGRQTRARGGAGAIGRVGGRGAAGAPTPTPGLPGAAPGAGGQNAPIPALIVPHIQTNSLIIQAEPEEYAEVISILEQIDIKRRQVFLEAALVEVSTQSSLTYTIELLAGEPDDRATRTLFESSFGLSGIDVENFNRVIPDLSNPAAVPPGALIAVMNRGKFPALIRFFKSNEDSQVLATPFVLADDNQSNTIEIIETIFVQNTNTTGTSGVTTTTNEGEDAGIFLNITPTISSPNSVFLELELEVSEFRGAGTGTVLPPKTTNTVTSAVSVPDGEIFVIGGLTRESKSKVVEKVPIIGDIPLIGKLFRDEQSSKRASNLYIFLRAHVLTHPDFLDGIDLTLQAQGFVHEFAPKLQPVRFNRPSLPAPPARPPDRDAPYRFYQREGRPRDHEEGYEAPRGVHEPLAPSDERARDTYHGDPESPLGPVGTAPPPGASFPGGATGAQSSPEYNAEVRRQTLQALNLEIDPGRDSWIVPVRAQTTPPPEGK